MSRYVILLMVIGTFVADVWTVSLGHALTWGLGVLVGACLEAGRLTAGYGLALTAYYW